MMRVFPWRSRRSGTEYKKSLMAKVDYLQRVDVFKGLTRDEIERFGKELPMQACASGTLFFTPYDTTERLFILKEGHVELYRLTVNGKKLVTRRLGPGSIFGEMGLMGQTMHGEFAEATGDALVCTATREDVLRILREHPDVAVRFLEAIGSRLKVLEERLQHAVFSPVPVRLASFILANANPKAGVVSGLTHAEIGDTIGALRQMVTETLSKWRNEGLIEVGHKCIQIKDWDGLKAIACREETAFR
jgi:CRP/FNR family transcriptional regulator, cyclic AMP receptor protein